MLLLIWADEKYNTQKNPGVFHRPKKIPFGQNVRPKKILRTPPSLKYVSGAPGDWVEPHQGIADLNWVELYCFAEAVTYFTNY